MLSYCAPDGSLEIASNSTRSTGQQHLYIGIFYVLYGFVGLFLNGFVLFVFTRPFLFSHTCYKLMAYITLLDIINLINSAIFPGIFSIFELHHCNAGIVVVVVATFQNGIWYLYCAASMTLAVNRVLMFAHSKFEKYLFSGRRLYLWLLFGIVYVAGVWIPVPDMFYIYNPYEGSYVLLRLSGQTNYVVVVSNLFKTIFITLIYAFMLILMYIDLRKVDKTAKICQFQRKVSVQTMVVAALADAAALGYAVIVYIPGFRAHAGVVAEILWISLHVGTSIVYVVMNKNVNQRFLKLMARLTCRSSKHVQKVSVVSMTSIVSKSVHHN
ncbi:hypothetical protein L596_012896 [Steinernema carpocapsae]|uniref:G-protein coupled receptors family 1 profile domain-containing protein n=1 Tax=Steinernema carpocapsae TaxID=34508 RepID=A0A4U5NYS3_STECR|nr:hypothetical protein L596_012896 [Steinernema carpocapsae]